MSSIIYEDGKPVALQGIAHDIHERKKAEFESKNQQQYEKLRTNIWKKAYNIDNGTDLIRMLFDEIGEKINYDHGSYLTIDHENKNVISEIGWDKIHGDDYGVGVTIPYQLFKHSFGKTIITFSINDIPIYAKPFVTQLLKKYKPKSLLMLPYGDINKPLAYLTLEDYSDPNRKWTEWEKNILKEVINIVSLKNQQIKAKNEIKHAQELLKKMNEKLESKVDERTSEIKHLLNQKDEFINQLGHDLKNPLGPLINLIPVLEKQETDPDKKEMLTVLLRNTGYMKNLVIKTIELAKLNSPNTRFNFQQMNLFETINNVIDANQLMYQKKNIDIYNELSDKIIINADPLRIEELLINLLSNAIKYTNNNGTININAMIQNNNVKVMIKDSGIGLTNEQMKHIFDEFYKADISRHDFYSSGLGMPICKRIVEKHGGKIWAESKGLGKGSIFYFSIPLNHQEKEQLEKVDNHNDVYIEIKKKVDTM